MNKYLEEAKAIRESINGLSANADDETLVDNKAAFPYWNGNAVLYATGDKVQYDNKLYRVLQAHTSEPNWTPELAVSLFVEIQTAAIPDWVQPSSVNPYMKGDKVKHINKVWISDIDNNVWEPSVYGWSEYKG